MNRKFEFEGVRFSIVIREITERNLNNAFFRISRESFDNLNLANNFSKWKKVSDIFLPDDSLAALELILHAIDTFEKDSTKSAVTVDYGKVIGWSLFDDISNYVSDDFEKFWPNSKSSGVRIKRNRTDIPAPKTSLITIIYEVKIEEGDVVIVIHSIYPGKCIGMWSGDISSRENIVFFHNDHPGE